jgi:hypothetical protein
MNRTIASQPAAVYAYSEAAKENGRLFGFRRSLGGRRSDAEGASPNSARYWTEKRPSSQKPYSVAISATGSSLSTHKCLRRRPA